MKKAEKELRNVAGQLIAVTAMLIKGRDKQVNRALINDAIEELERITTLDGRGVIDLMKEQNAPSPFVEFGTGKESEILKHWFQTAAGDLKPAYIGMPVEISPLSKAMNDISRQIVAGLNDDADRAIFEVLMGKGSAGTPLSGLMGLTREPYEHPLDFAARTMRNDNGETPAEELARKNEELKAMIAEQAGDSARSIGNTITDDIEQEGAIKKALAEMPDFMLKGFAKDLRGLIKIGGADKVTVKHLGVTVPINRILDAVNGDGTVNEVCDGCGWRHS